MRIVSHTTKCISTEEVAPGTVIRSLDSGNYFLVLAEDGHIKSTPATAVDLLTGELQRLVLRRYVEVKGAFVEGYEEE